MQELLPNQLAPMIEKRLTGLKSLLAIKKKACEKAPRGRIRISQNGGHPEYYLVTERGSLRGKYLPHSQEELARRALITPVTLTDEQYAARWQEVSWTGRSFAPDAPLLYTANKERVRSKPEIIIADTLFRYNVPYRYKFPLTLRRNNTLSPLETNTDQINNYRKIYLVVTLPFLSIVMLLIYGFAPFKFPFGNVHASQ